MDIHFFVPGIPAPKGSKTNYGVGRLVESSKRLRPWMDAIQKELYNMPRETRKHWPILGPIRFQAIYLLPRPKKAGPREALSAVKKPDLDKLNRAVWDALSGLVIVDDCQIVWETSEKIVAPHAAKSGAQIYLSGGVRQ